MRLIRRLAGVFDPTGRANQATKLATLAGDEDARLELGALRVVCGGAEPPHTGPLIAFDGFLDNGLELARDLAPSDAPGVEQLLAAGYQRWGRELPSRMRGDFVLLVWDEHSGEGLLARDQLGVRTVYTHQRDGAIFFANEIGDLLALLGSTPEPDPVGVAHWISASSRPGAHTLYAGVSRLAPGSALLLEHAGVREHRYWRPRYVEPAHAPVCELAEHLRGAIDRSVARRLDERLTAVLMSGGLDSASVAAVAAQTAPGRVGAYAGTFPEHPAVDESELIDELRGELRLPGATAEAVGGGLLASVIDATRAWQAPPAGWGDFWTLPLLRAAAADGARVVLGGDGGDELFGARGFLMADRLRAVDPLGAFALAHELPGAGGRPPRRQLARILVDRALLGALPHSVHACARRMRASSRVAPWLRPHTASALAASDESLAWKRLDGPRWWAHLADGIANGAEQTGLFEHLARRAALAGMQARHPLLDLDLVELSLRQPPRASFDRERSRPLLRASMAGALPDSVRLRRQKAWFDSLVVDCLAHSDAPAIRRLLTGPDTLIGAYADTQTIERELLDPGPTRPGGSFRWMHHVWRLTTLECWLRQCYGDEHALDDLTPSAARVRVRAVTNNAQAACAGAGA
jgi:asparagine synthase (glutamine-hydrolysing)